MRHRVREVRYCKPLDIHTRGLKRRMRRLCAASGIYTNQAISSLAFLHSLTLCYDEPYSHATTSAALEACVSQGSHVFVAATLNSSVVVGAGGEMSCVFQASNTAHACNGAFWYKTTGSVGFSPTSNIALNSALNYADSSLPGDISRLSWVLDRTGGFRAGSVNNLDNDVRYRKRIWVGTLLRCSPALSLPASLAHSLPQLTSVAHTAHTRAHAHSI